MRLTVPNRMPFAFPLRRMERFASVMPTLAQSHAAGFQHIFQVNLDCHKRASSNKAVVLILQALVFPDIL